MNALDGAVRPLTVMPGRPGLIASDLDGTFLSPDGTVSTENAEAVLAAQEAGIPVVFATGRPVRWLDVIRELPGAHPTVIASNGAVLYDLGSGELLDRVCLPTDVALESVERIRALVPGAAFAFESGTRFGHEPTYQTWTDLSHDPAVFAGPVEQVARTCDFVKMLVQSRELGADQLLEHIRTALDGTLTATHSVTRGFGLVEVSAPGVSKASMLERTCARLGIPASRVAAFGDMPNDVAMLRWVGMPRVVANAHPSLLDSGFPVVPSNAESGVGRTIQAWLQSPPELVDPLPELVDPLPELVDPLPELVDPLPELVDPLPELVDPLPELVDPLPELVDPLPELVDPLPELVDPLPELVDPLPELVDPLPELVDPLPELVDPLPELVDPLPELVDPLPELVEGHRRGRHPDPVS